MQRNGKLVSLHNNEIVAGDVVVVTEGMEIPADGWVILSNDIKADESLVTGENDSISKETYEKALQLRNQAQSKSGSVSFREVPSPILLAGSKVALLDFFITNVVRF